MACQRERWTGPGRDYQLADVICVGDHLVSSVRADERPRAAPSAAPGPADRPPAPPVCAARSRLDLDELYLERVGLLESVRLYNQGFSPLR